MGRILEGIEGLLCDLDGVVYRGNETIPGSPDAIAALRGRGVKVVFCTNNSRSTVAQYKQRLGEIGISAPDDEILTSAVVTAEVLQSRDVKGATAIVVGGDGIRSALTEIEVEILDDPATHRSDFVIVGWDPQFDYEAMKRAALALRDGAQFIATNDDAAFPAPDGLWPGAGAILASIAVAADRRAEVMGKPHRPMMEAAARRFGNAARIVVVGDRPETDLLGGAAMGWTTVLVLTGVTGRSEAAKLKGPPDMVVERLADLVDVIQ